MYVINKHTNVCLYKQIIKIIKVKMSWGNLYNAPEQYYQEPPSCVKEGQAYITDVRHTEWGRGGVQSTINNYVSKDI